MTTAWCATIVCGVALLLSPRLRGPWTQTSVYLWYIVGWWMNKGAAYVRCIVTKTASVQCQPSTGAATWFLWPFCSNTQSSAQQLGYSLMACRQNVNKTDRDISELFSLLNGGTSLPPARQPVSLNTDSLPFSNNPKLCSLARAKILNIYWKAMLTSCLLLMRVSATQLCCERLSGSSAVGVLFKSHLCWCAGATVACNAVFLVVCFLLLSLFAVLFQFVLQWNQSYSQTVASMF